MMSEYNCDRCGVYVPDGEGSYIDNDDRVCPDCAANGWSVIDYDDKSTWPPEGRNIFVASVRGPKGLYLGIAGVTRHSDMVSIFKPFKWREKLFITGIRFRAKYWRPLIDEDFPPNEMTVGDLPDV